MRTRILVVAAIAATIGGTSLAIASNDVSKGLHQDYAYFGTINQGQTDRAMQEVAQPDITAFTDAIDAKPALSVRTQHDGVVVPQDGVQALTIDGPDSNLSGVVNPDSIGNAIGKNQGSPEVHPLAIEPGIVTNDSKTADVKWFEPALTPTYRFGSNA